MILAEIPNQLIDFPNHGVSLHIKREDTIHEFISGNKYRKLKYNILVAKEAGATRLLTFGGAYSNHIAAVAAAGKYYGFETIGIIRGEELASEITENPTLAFAAACGMQFQFISRSDYRQKDQKYFLELLQENWEMPYIIPEGGTNALAVKGCEEILTIKDSDFDYICCAVGTGGTIAGLINSSVIHQQVLGFPALKGEFLKEEIQKFTKNDRWMLVNDYHFGGYGKVTPELIAFINDFYSKNKIPLDPIYTGKMVFGVIDLITKGFFPKDSKILMIHTGGLQGIAGMNKKLQTKKLPILNVNA